MQQEFNRLVSHADASAEDQFGLHPAGAVGAARREMHFPDEVSQPGMANRSSRGSRFRQAE